MDRILKTVPSSDLRFKQAELLDQLKESPVLLTRQGKAAAVLVSPDQWNEIAEQIEDLQLALDAAEARQAVEPVIDFDDYLMRRGDHVPDTVER